MTTSDDLATDLLWGAEAIGNYAGLTEREARHKIAKGYLPARKCGAILVSTKSEIRQVLRGPSRRVRLRESQDG